MNSAELNWDALTLHLMSDQIADKIKIQFKFDKPVDFSYKI